MSNKRTSAMPLVMGAFLGVSATSIQAADLEFYFPVGVNAPAVATIEELTAALGGPEPAAHRESRLCRQLRGNDDQGADGGPGRRSAAGCRPAFNRSVHAD